MRKRVLIALFGNLLGAVALALVLTWAVGAQGPEPGEPEPHLGPRGLHPVPPTGVRLDEKPALRLAPSGGPGAQGVSAAVALGQPGLSFRYVQTFGETEVAYISDTTHINFPYGIGTAGTNVWIGESFGRRALKFTNTGSFVTSIGNAGFYRYQDQVIHWIADVAVDGTGNTWVVDGDASHVLKFNASGNYVSKLGEAWNPGSDNSHFDKPVSIAFDSAGNVYISDGVERLWSSDVGNHRIQIFSSSGNYRHTIGTTGTAGSGNFRFRGPRRIAIYGNYLYVADSGNHRVQIFGITNPVSPTYVATIGITGESGSDNVHLNNPSGVAVDANYIYVADTWNDRVQIFNRTTRAYVATIGTGWGTDNTQFKNPSDVAVDTAGNIYVADFVNCRVQQFNSSRNYVRTYGVTGVPYVTDGYHYNAPAGVAVAPDGSLYIVEDNGHRLLKLDAAGVLQWTVGAAGVKGDWDYSNDRLNNPADVALDTAGRAYVADRWHQRVQIFNSNGSYYTTLDGFDCPGGLTIAPNGYLYVADSCDHAVKIFDSSLNPVATLGTPGESGLDNTHFNDPQDVAVDGNGIIYVADKNNHRVQVFNSSRIYQKTLGTTGEEGDDFDHFGGPEHLFVDAANRLYVADSWNNRVQVFDPSGAYLTTVGGSWGTGTGQMRDACGIAVDSAGNVYVTDRNNHRIQKFAPGVPGWRQVNINGFGNRRNEGMTSLAVFSDTLYAGTANFDTGGEIWRMGSPWTAVITGGLGSAYNVGIDHLIEFKGNFYAGTWADETNGGEVWRYNGVNWTRVVSQGFGDPTNAEIGFIVFSDTLYVSTGSYTESHGAEIWRSSSGNAGDWARVVANGFGDADNRFAPRRETFNSYLYVGTFNWDVASQTSTGGEVWRSSTGNSSSWSQVNTSGFGDSDNIGVTSSAVFNSYLYAGTQNWTTGGQVWRCSGASGCDENSDWA